MYFKITKVANLISYMSSFKVLKFTDEIKVIPVAFSIGKVGGDDTWGVRLQLIWPQTLDGYFIINNILFHPKFNNALWMESAYTSGFVEKEKIKKSGMQKEWAIAKKIEGEIRFNVLNFYDNNNHMVILKYINELTNYELELLNLVRISAFDKTIDKFVFRISSHWGRKIEFGNHSGSFNTDDYLGEIDLFMKTLQKLSTKQLLEKPVVYTIYDYHNNIELPEKEILLWNPSELYNWGN